jgi:hypothetical protein
MDMETKICSVCGEDKSVEEFYSRGNECKICKRKKCRDYFSNNPDYQKKWQKDNSIRFRELKKKWKKNNPDKAKEQKKQENKRARQRDIINLHDRYIKKKILKNYEVKKPTPELIEAVRIQTKVKRLIKTKKDENTKTS